MTVMHAEGIGCIVVVDARLRPVGIFTERDLIGVALGAGLDRPIAEVMTREPLGLPGHTPAYDAALAMIDHRIRHVLVTEADALVGVVAERDLFSLQRLGLGEITMEIRLARDIDALAGLAARVRRLARLLVEQGVAAEQLTLFVSVLNDRICQRIIEIVRNRHRWERIGWCWLAFGSEGRLEQTFATDQDNGLVFESHGGAAAADVRAQLLPFAREVNEALDACGYPLCKGNVMASNPELCLSVAEWQAKMEGWLHNSEPKALLDATICLDFRALHGDGRLASVLRDWLLGRTRTAANFLRLMAENALQARPPLGKWRDFATEDAPNAPRTINLKLHGVRPFVDTARIMALARGLPQTATAERLRAASAAGALAPGRRRGRRRGILLRPADPVAASGRPREPDRRDREPHRPGAAERARPSDAEGSVPDRPRPAVAARARLPALTRAGPRGFRLPFATARRRPRARATALHWRLAGLQCKRCAASST